MKPKKQNDSELFSTSGFSEPVNDSYCANGNTGDYISQKVYKELIYSKDLVINRHK